MTGRLAYFHFLFLYLSGLILKSDMRWNMTLFDNEVFTQKSMSILGSCLDS